MLKIFYKLKYRVSLLIIFFSLIFSSCNQNVRFQKQLEIDREYSFDSMWSGPEYWIFIYGILVLILILHVLHTSYNQVAESKREFSSYQENPYSHVLIRSGLCGNRLQDWSIYKDRLVCVIANVSKPMRTIHFLSRQISNVIGNLEMKVVTGVIDESESFNRDAATGFLIGAEENNNYQGFSLIHHGGSLRTGLFAGIDVYGSLFIYDCENGDSVLVRKKGNGEILSNIKLKLTIEKEQQTNKLVLTAINKKGKLINWIELNGINEAKVLGNIALVSHPGIGIYPARFWFRDWEISGSDYNLIEDLNFRPMVNL